MARRRSPAADRMPDGLVTFDPRDWPPGPADSDPGDGADSASAAAWHRTLRRRRWRRARIEWLAAHGQPTLPEFLGWRSREDADFAATVDALRAGSGEMDGGSDGTRGRSTAVPQGA